MKGTYMNLADLVTFLESNPPGFRWPLAEILGVAGTVVYAVPYGFVQLRRLDGNGMAFAATNAVAATLSAVSLAVQWNTAFAATSAFFFLASLKGIFSQARERVHAHRAATRPSTTPAAVPAQQWTEPTVEVTEEEHRPPPPLTREERAALAAATATATATAVEVREQSLTVRKRLQETTV